MAEQQKDSGLHQAVVLWYLNRLLGGLVVLS
jgi:hypothetical protein